MPAPPLGDPPHLGLDLVPDQVGCELAPEAVTGVP